MNFNMSSNCCHRELNCSELYFIVIQSISKAINYQAGIKGALIERYIYSPKYNTMKSLSLKIDTRFALQRETSDLVITRA